MFTILKILNIFPFITSVDRVMKALQDPTVNSFYVSIFIIDMSLSPMNMLSFMQVIYHPFPSHNDGSTLILTF